MRAYIQKFKEVDAAEKALRDALEYQDKDDPERVDLIAQYIRLLAISEGTVYVYILGFWLSVKV